MFHDKAKLSDIIHVSKYINIKCSYTKKMQSMFIWLKKRTENKNVFE